MDIKKYAITKEVLVCILYMFYALINYVGGEDIEYVRDWVMETPSTISSVEHAQLERKYQADTMSSWVSL